MDGPSTERIGLLLKPLDVLFFRDGRPFEAGFRGETGLPTPNAFAGLVRTHLLRLAGVDLRRLNAVQARDPRLSLAEALEAIGGPVWVGAARCRGPWPYRAPEGPLVVAPSDVVQEAKVTGARRLHRMRPLPGNAPVAGWKPPLDGMRPLWLASEKVTPEAVHGWLGGEDLRTYVAGGEPQRFVREDELLVREERTGIAIDLVRDTARDASIYFAQFLRLRREVELYGEVEVPDGAPSADELFPDDLCLPLGGEGRRVHLRRVRPFEWPCAEPHAGRIATVLITPAVLPRSSEAHGWCPRLGNARLVAASVPGHEPVSGWDMARGRPKPLRYAVPAGSIFYWEMDGQPLQPGLESFSEGEEGVTGWGLFLRGTWEYHEQSI